MSATSPKEKEKGNVPLSIEKDERRNKNPNDIDHKGPRTPRGSFTPKPLEGDELKAAIQKQVEYYFSKENLQVDWYLRSQMNAEMFVPIKTIAEFRMLKSLTTDLELIVSVMKKSQCVVVDETGAFVRPTLRAFRNTLILRDIPSTTDPEEVKGIFKDMKNSEGKTIEILDISSDIGDCWYVTFENDDVAIKILESLRGQLFKNQPVQARIKTESNVRNVFASVSYDPNTTAYGYPLQTTYMVPPFQPYWDSGARGGSYDTNRGGRGSFGRGKKSSGGRGGGRGNYRGNNFSQGKEPNGSASTRKRRGSQGANINLAADFPPLPSAAFEQSKTRYTTDFVNYSKNDLVNIINEIPKEKITKPNHESDLQGVILEEPNIELEVLKPYPKRATVADIVMGPVNQEKRVEPEKQAEQKVNIQEAQHNTDKQQKSEKHQEKKGERKEKPHKGEKRAEKSNRNRSTNNGNNVSKGPRAAKIEASNVDQKESTKTEELHTETKETKSTA